MEWASLDPKPSNALKALLLPVAVAWSDSFLSPVSLLPLPSRPCRPSGTSIIQVTATDADDPTYGNSAKLVYTLVQGQQYFSVDPQTGERALRTTIWSF